MRILIATDAWHPQVNGVVRTLTSLARSAATLDADINFPDARRVSLRREFRPIPACGWRCRTAREIARRIEQAAPEAIHIATEGPIGWAVRGYCLPQQARLHHLLHHAVPGVCRSPHHDSGERRLRVAAALPLGRIDDDGRNRFAPAGTRRTRLSQARLLGTRRRHRTVQSGQPCHARPAAADLHDHGPRCRRKEYRGVSFTRSARH